MGFKPYMLLVFTDIMWGLKPIWLLHLLGISLFQADGAEENKTEDPCFQSVRKDVLELRVANQGWGYSSMVKHLLSMHRP